MSADVDPNLAEIARLDGELAAARADGELLRAALRAAQTALYDAMHAGHLSREYHNGVAAKIDAALAREPK